jgi:hypothetical protein
MAEKQSWQSQNMKKSGTVAGPSSMNSKITGNSFHCGNAKVSKPTVRNYADGGMVEREAEDKAAGLKASAGEKVGFFERLRMGNIDDPKSEAYNRLGAGRAKADRDMESEAAAMKMVDDSRSAPAKADAPVKAAEDLGAFNQAGSSFMDEKEPGWDTKPAPAAQKPVARKAPVVASKRVASKPAPATKTKSASLAQRLGKDYADLERAAQNAVKMPQATPESKARVRKMADDARKAYEAAADAEKTGRSVVLKR